MLHWASQHEDCPRVELKLRGAGQFVCDADPHVSAVPGPKGPRLGGNATGHPYASLLSQEGSPMPDTVNFEPVGMSNCARRDTVITLDLPGRGFVCFMVFTHNVGGSTRKGLKSSSWRQPSMSSHSASFRQLYDAVYLLRYSASVLTRQNRKSVGLSKCTGTRATSMQPADPMPTLVATRVSAPVA